MMTLFTERSVQMDELLDKIADSLALTQEQWQRMETTYKALYDWLKKDDGYFQRIDFEVYPQGSVRIGAAIKPLKRDEFDLDLVVHLLDFEPNLLPLIVFGRLKRRLEENPAYKGKLETKNRCMRINVASDYHMDVLPGCQVNVSGDKNTIRIPDRVLDLWVLSNPRGYAEWFLGQVNLAREVLLEKRYTQLKQENITRKVFMNKPLQRAVQLIKRFRDLYFEDKEFATSSIVLTTIFGLGYAGEGTIFETIDNALERIRAHAIASPGGRLKVLNPVNQNEDFTDKWEKEPQYYEAFKAFSLHVYDQWQILKRQPGTLTESRVLSLLAGDAPVQTAFRNQAGQVSILQEAGLLGINPLTGNIAPTTSPTSIPVKRNTFYGA